MNHQLIKVCIFEESDYSFEIWTKENLEESDFFKSLNHSQFHSIEIESYENYGSSGLELKIYIKRLETDKEVHDRLEKTEAIKRMQKVKDAMDKEKDLKLLKELKEKYETN